MNNAENVVVMDTVITNENNKKYVYHMVKRTFDIMVALIACLFLLPLSIIVKVVSLLSGDTHSIFYKQIRVGKDGKLFYIYKFRSMVPNADELLEAYQEGKLYGELKDLASSLKDEDNDVLILYKFK